MGQRNCKVSPRIGEVYDQHPSTPPKPGIKTEVQHPHPRDETPGGAGEGNSQERSTAEGEVRGEEERRVMERGDEGGEEERRVMERDGGGEEERRVMERGDGGGEEERRVMERDGGGEEERRVMERDGGIRRGGGGEEEKEELGRVQEKRKRKKKKWWKRFSFFRTAKKHPPENSSGQGEAKPQQDEGEKRVASAGRSSADYITSRYRLGDQIGKGGFGDVYEGRRLEDDLKVAMKFVIKTECTEFLLIPDHPNPVPKEIALTILANKAPSTPEIIRLLDWHDRSDHFVMVLEYPHPCEDLFQFMRRHGGTLEEETAKQIMRQAVQAANVCCLQGVLHRDIKLHNLLINSETSEVKLIDFGCGDILRSTPYRSYSGTAAFVPPEYNMRGMYHGEQATTWSLGVLMFAMLCGHYPSQYELLLLRRKLWYKSDLSSECCDLLRALLHERPSQRLELGLILSHNWFKFVKIRPLQSASLTAAW